jgi:hypothetical protein
MAIEVSSNFLLGVRDFLDSRQKVETVIDLNNINVDYLPDLFIVYCEEDDCYYQYVEATNTWKMLDLDINEYLYEKDENGNPDLNKPLYIEEDRMSLLDEAAIQAWIDDGGVLTSDDELIDYIVDDSVEDATDKTYSSELIESKYTDLYTRFKTYADERLRALNNIVYIKVDSVDEMDRTDVFYLIQDDPSSEYFQIYVLSEDGWPIALGSSEMDISGFQPLRDAALTTTSKAVVGAINEVNKRAKNVNDIIGDYNNLAVPEQDDLYIATSYIADKAKTIGKINELTTNSKNEVVSAINEISNEVGLLEDLKMSDKSSVVNAINSFISEIINIGTIIAYSGTIIPDNYLICDGTIYSKSQYPLLYEALDESFRTSVSAFRVPNLVGKVPVYFNMGYSGGTEEVALTINQVGAHSHECTSQSHYHTGYVGYRDAFYNLFYYGTGLAQKVSSRNNYLTWYGTSTTYIGNHRHTLSVSNSSHTHYSQYTGYGGQNLSSQYTYKDESNVIHVSEPHSNIQQTMNLYYLIKAK